LPHQDYVTSVAFSPDGKLAATGCADRIARLWDMATGSVVQQFSGHTDSVVSVAFSPDGRLLLTGGKDPPRACGTWRREGATPVQGPYGGGAQRRLFVGCQPGADRGEDLTARLWNATTGQEIRQFVGHTAAVWSVAFAPDAKTVLTGSWDLTARLWDATTGQEIRQFKGHNKLRLECGFFARRELRADRQCRLHGTPVGCSTGKELRQFNGHADAVWAATFSPDGNTF